MSFYQKNLGYNLYVNGQLNGIYLLIQNVASIKMYQCIQEILGNPSGTKFFLTWSNIEKKNGRDAENWQILNNEKEN